MSTIFVSDPTDDRLADFRALNDQAYRRKFESDEFFIVEGYVASVNTNLFHTTMLTGIFAPSRVGRFEPHLERFAEADVPVFVAEKRTIAEIVGFDMHRGVIASAYRKQHPTLDEMATTATRIAVLEGLNDAENLGAISRAARAFGIDGLVIDPTCTDPYSRRTVRVSMGEVLFLPIARVSESAWPSTFADLDGARFVTWAMTPERSATSIWDTAVPDRLAVVFGAEGPGLTEQALAGCNRKVRVPIRSEVDSLNVGHAAAIPFAAIARPDISAQT